LLVLFIITLPAKTKAHKIPKLPAVTKPVLNRPAKTKNLPIKLRHPKQTNKLSRASKAQSEVVLEKISTNHPRSRKAKASPQQKNPIGGITRTTELEA
jgi:hypothetical protein